MKIKIKRMDEDVELPKYQHLGEDCGMDLKSRYDYELKPAEYKLIKTGLKIAIPKGYGGFIYPRSGLALNNGITVLNADGVIDPGYRGEVGVLLINHSDQIFKINKNDRIAQLIIHKTYQIEFIEVNNLGQSLRDQGGFGHTGRQ
ncbi:MAG: dUTP diphosphatase [Halanaerobiales bacterium]|nr:dUTP diphosphatase [Halanaerobiales bacterium]